MKVESAGSDDDGHEQRPWACEGVLAAVRQVAAKAPDGCSRAGVRDVGCDRIPCSDRYR